MPPAPIRRPLTITTWIVVSSLCLLLSPFILVAGEIAAAVTRRPQPKLLARLVIEYFARELLVLRTHLEASLLAGSCVISPPCDGVSQLTCAVQGSTVSLSWQNGLDTSGVKVLRDGAVVASFQNISANAVNGAPIAGQPPSADRVGRSVARILQETGLCAWATVTTPESSTETTAMPKRCLTICC